MNKLIKLEQGYIIVSDKTPTINDFALYSKYIRKVDNTFNQPGMDWNALNTRKIIASTFISKLPNIDFNNLEEEFGIINVEKLANISANEIWNDEHTLENEQRELNGHMLGYVEGFNKCSKLNKDKLYTEKDIKNAIKWLTKNYSKVEDELAHPLETNQVELPDNFFENVYEEALNRAIQSLQPKTEWDVEVEKTENSIKIIKQYEK